MRDYIVKTVKIGDSIVIALPRELLAAEHISENMDIKITVQKCLSGYTAPERVSPSCDDDDPWRLLE